MNLTSLEKKYPGLTTAEYGVLLQGERRREAMEQHRNMGSITGFPIDKYEQQQWQRSYEELNRLAMAEYQRKNAAIQVGLTAKPKEKKHMFSFAKDYTEKHKDSIMTIVVVLLVDYFFLGGALRQKIKSIAENALDSAQKKLSHTPDAVKPGASKDAA